MTKNTWIAIAAVTAIGAGAGIFLYYRHQNSKPVLIRKTMALIPADERDGFEAKLNQLNENQLKVVYHFIKDVAEGRTPESSLALQFQSINEYHQLAT